MGGETPVFVSVGSTSSDQQEAFVCAVEARLRAEGLVPHTVGRNTFSSDAPLKAVTELMSQCSGAVVIALERSFFPSGFDKPGGPKQKPLADVRLPTPWNQIEAAMAWSRGLPLLVIVEVGLRPEGLLERGYDWYAQELPAQSASLSGPEFSGVLASWKQKVLSRPASSPDASIELPRSAAEMTVGQLVGSLTPAQVWSLLAALGALIAGAFGLGAKLFPHHWNFYSAPWYFTLQP
jgi:hypothetical protein